MVYLSWGSVGMLLWKVRWPYLPCRLVVCVETAVGRWYRIVTLQVGRLTLEPSSHSPPPVIKNNSYRYNRGSHRSAASNPSPTQAAPNQPGKTETPRIKPPQP